MYIEIVREDDIRLHSLLWRFDIQSNYSTGGIKISVDTYAARTRKTTRHKWVNYEIFGGLDRRHNTLTNEEVPLPEDVKKELRNELIKEVNKADITVEKR